MDKNTVEEVSAKEAPTTALRTITQGGRKPEGYWRLLTKDSMDGQKGTTSVKMDMSFNSKGRAHSRIEFQVSNSDTKLQL